MTISNDTIGSIYMETGSRWDPSHSPTQGKFVEHLHETRQVVVASLWKNPVLYTLISP